MSLGPQYFIGKTPSDETAQAAVDAKAKGLHICYPPKFLKLAEARVGNQKQNTPEKPEHQPQDKTSLKK